MRLTVHTFFIAVLLFLPLALRAQSASPQSEPERAAVVYATNRTAGVAILADFYRRSPANFFVIKSRLITLQSYLLYRDFLEGLPRTKDHVTELFQTKLLIGDTNDLILDLTNAVALGMAPDALSGTFYAAVCEPGVTAYFAKYLGVPAVFKLMAKSYLAANRLADFDAVIRAMPRDVYLDKTAVRAYIADSWGRYQRPLEWLIERYSLGGEPFMDALVVYSRFAAGDYPSVIRLAANPALDARQLSQRNIDLNYYVSYSDFRTGDYRGSIDKLGQAAFPWSYDLSRVLFLDYLGMTNLTKARAQLQGMKSADAKKFYGAYLDLASGKTNEGIASLEKYLFIVESDREYPLEAMMILYTYYNQKDSLGDVLELVRQSLLFRYDGGTVDKIAFTAVYAAAGGHEVPDVPQGYSGDFVRYKHALDALAAGNRADARSILTELASGDAVSPLVKSLALYQLRKLS